MEVTIVAVLAQFVVAERAAELHFVETKTVAETVRGAGEFFELARRSVVQQIELFVAVSQPAEGDSEEPDFSFHIPMRAK